MPPSSNYAGISLRKTSKFLGDFEKFSHEAVRQWYHKLARLFTNCRKYRRCIAMDETKIKIGNEWWYVWAAMSLRMGNFRNNDNEMENFHRCNKICQ